MKIVIALLFFLIQPDSFSKFTYCLESSRGLYERQCVELNPAGKGPVRLKRRNADELKVDVSLSTSARDRFLTLLAATRNLEQAETYESGRKVADLGRKRLTLELPSGERREADFNYSIRKEVIDLVSFFEGVTNQEMIGFDIDTALQFDRLSIPKHLERIERDLKSNRVADPERLVSILDKIRADQRIVNYARNQAGKMKEQILAKKGK
jgi:hypothetical protein